MSPFRFRIQLLVLASFLGFTCAPINAQIQSLTDATATPMPGVGHDYIGNLSETVNPFNGSVSLRIETPTPSGRKMALPFSFAYDTSGIFYGTGTGWNQTPSSGYVSSGGWTYSLPMLSYQTLRPNTVERRESGPK